MKKNLLILLSALLLVACNNTDTTSSQNSEEPSVSNNESLSQEESSSLPESTSTTEPLSVKSALTQLASKKNYTLASTLTSGQAAPVPYSIMYTENSYMYTLSSTTFGYVKDETGVFRFDYYLDEFTPSEYLSNEENVPYTDIWDQELFTSLSDFNLNSFNNATGKTFTITNKLVRLDFFSIVGLANTYYDKIVDFTASVEDSLDSLKFVMNLTDTDSTPSVDICVEFVVDDIDSTRIVEVDNFLADGNGGYQVPAGLSKVRDLIYSNNFVHVISNNDGTVLLKEHFTEKYFFGENLSSEMLSSGYIGFDHINNGTEILNGYYQFMIIDNAFQLIFKYGDDYNYIPEIMLYPSYMEMFSNLQFFKPTETANTYITYNYNLIDDFVNNFQLRTEELNELGATFYSLSVEYTNINAINDKDVIVVFTLEVFIENELYQLQRTITDFGNANVDVIEAYITSLGM